MFILASRGLFTRNEGLAGAAKPRGANDGGTIDSLFVMHVLQVWASIRH
jgi:hypothetical protein